MGNGETGDGSIRLEAPIWRDKVSISFGRIDEVTADALVCPYDGSFFSTSLEGELLIIKFGDDPFRKAKEAESHFKGSLREIGLKGEVHIPPGYSVATGVGLEGSSVKKIIHTNISNTGESKSQDPVRLAVGNSLEVAESTAEVKTVAVPLFGEITPETFRPRLLSIIGGIKDYFKDRPDSKIEKVILVVNADDNEKNRNKIESILSSQN